MRLKKLMAALAAVLAIGLVSTAAAEAGWRKKHAPASWGRTRTITHHIYYPRYRHVYKVHSRTDPYAYHYEPRGYYRHSSSHYWVSAHKMSHRRRHRHAHGAKYRYRPAWGHKHHGSHKGRHHRH